MPGPAFINRVARCALFLLLLPLTSCDLLNPSQEQVAIRVGRQEITLDTVRRDIERISIEMDLYAEEIEPVFEPLVKRLVERYVLLAYGAEHGIAVKEPELEAAVQSIKSDYPSEEDFRNMLLKRYVDFDVWESQLKEKLLIQKIIEKGMQEIKPVTFEEIQRAYEKNLDSYRHPPMVRFRQITARDVETARRILALAKKQGGLATLVQQEPERIENAVGMADRWVTREELQASLAETVFSLPVGLSDEPVKTPYGYHVVEVTERRPEGVFSLPEVMVQIEQMLMEEKRDAFYRNWIKELKTRFPVKVNRDVLNKLEIE